MTFRTCSKFSLALSAALTSRRPTTLRQLPSSHGRRAFAVPIASCPMHPMADDLSVHPYVEQANIALRLYPATRTRLAQIVTSCRESGTPMRWASTFEVFKEWPLRRWFIKNQIVRWPRHGSKASFSALLINSPLAPLAPLASSAFPNKRIPE